MSWREELEHIVTAGELRFDEPMRDHTSFRIGGPADAFVMPASRDELRVVAGFAAVRALPWLILGRGTNLLIKDGGIRGLVLKTEPCLRWFALRNTEIRAGAGLSLAELAARAASESLAGLAFAAGIPGTLGGGIYMNAGAYGGELSQVTQSVTAYYPGEGERIWTGEEIAPGYRTSRFQAERCIIEEAAIVLQPGDESAIREEMARLAARRRERQPLSLPSAGSVFKRPAGGYAGTLIEQAGLKGTRIGDAQVSEMHANFIVNLGAARAADVLALIELVRARVRERTGFLLEPEVRVLGED